MRNERSNKIDDPPLEFEIEKELYWRKRTETKRRDESLIKLPEDHAA
jgi:hypothetical protein